MRGLLSYRSALANIGIGEGFQWLSGSFLEDIETLENRPPGDVDVVTICKRPVGLQGPTLQALVHANPAVFIPAQAKAQFHCDAQFIDMNLEPAVIVDYARFWFGLFSHRRNALWKGMLQVSLATPADDAAALSFLTRTEPQ